MTALPDQKPAKNTNSHEVYNKIYKCLDSTRHEIRLLTLHPATEEYHQICCTLSHAELKPSDGSASPAYEALSYVWGKPEFSELILLNHQEFLITPSLKYALSCLRSKTQPRVLWVDAVCINQSDIAERNQQVALMRDIYSRCQRDIAWLDPMIGKGSESADLYSDPRLPEMEDSIKKGMDLMHTIIEKDHKTLQGMLRHLEDGGYVLDHDDESCLRALFGSPTLWERLWVMQELSLAPSLVLMCRHAELSWDSSSTLLKDEPYFDAFHVWRSHHRFDNLPDWSDTFVRIKLIEDQRRLFSKPGQFDSNMMDVLARFREMDSTDPRDRIYSLLGLVTDNHGIKVAYTTSLRDLYQETTISLINLSSNLDILCQNPFEGIGGHRALHRANDAMPSWVAEFNSSYKDCAEVLFGQRNIFNAGVKHFQTPCRVLGPGKDTLVVRGIILGTIAPVLEDRAQKNGARDIMELYFGKEAIMNPKQHIYAPKFGDKTMTSGETCMRAFWRTLVRDCTLPPQMRRLRKKEIKFLERRNQTSLRHEKTINVETIRLNDNKHKPESPFSHYLGKVFDYSRLRGNFFSLPAGDAWVSYTKDDCMFVVTENGLYVLARPHVRAGDVVIVLDGGKVPMVLRRAEQKSCNGEAQDSYRLVCPAYVHGFMDGEAEAGVAEGWLKKQNMLLV